MMLQCYKWVICGILLSCGAFPGNKDKQDTENIMLNDRTNFVEDSIPYHKLIDSSVSENCSQDSAFSLAETQAFKCIESRTRLIHREKWIAISFIIGVLILIIIYGLIYQRIKLILRKSDEIGRQNHNLKEAIHQEKNKHNQILKLLYETNDQLVKDFYEKNEELSELYRSGVEKKEKFISFIKKNKKQPDIFVKKLIDYFSSKGFIDWEALVEVTNLFYYGIINHLKQQYPSLNENDLRLCSLLCWEVKNDVIMNFLDLEMQNSLYKKRSNLRQRLGLDKNVDLDDFFKLQVEKLKSKKYLTDTPIQEEADE